MERPFSFRVNPIKLTALRVSLLGVDVRLDHAQQGAFSHQLHRDRREPPACCGAANPAQPFCYELHGKMLPLFLLCTRTCTNTQAMQSQSITITVIHSYNPSLPFLCSHSPPILPLHAQTKAHHLLLETSFL